jgi:hypothetical protein
MKASSILLYVCVLIAGVFIGIWVDRAARQKLVGCVVGPQDIKYDLDDSKEARLKVYTGDTITLVSDGGVTTNRTITIEKGKHLCETSDTNINPCIVAADADKGLIHFTCSSKEGISCPDPAIQQSGTHPPAPPAEVVKR